MDDFKGADFGKLIGLVVSRYKGRTCTSHMELRNHHLSMAARVGNMARQMACASGKIYEDKGRLIALATATFFLTPTLEQSPRCCAP
jgi:hypothetical protein